MIRRFILLTGLALYASGAHASSCPQIFLDDRPPTVSAPAPTARETVLCNLAFAVMASGETREPVWSAEHLTRAAIRGARHQIRQDAFHEEHRQPVEDRARLVDYKQSGFDRGHLAPSGDAPTAEAQKQSFSLANMVPQTPDLNRGLWAGVEKQVRDLAVAEGEVYVVSGPAYRTLSPVQIGPDALPVPTSTWKAVYLPSRREAGVYVCKNTPAPSCTQVPVATLVRVTGVDPFPSLAAEIKQRAAALPAPQAEPYHVSPKLRRLTMRILGQMVRSMLSGESPL